MLYQSSDKFRRDQSPSLKSARAVEIVDASEVLSSIKSGSSRNGSNIEGE